MLYGEQDKQVDTRPSNCRCKLRTESKFNKWLSRGNQEKDSFVVLQSCFTLLGPLPRRFCGPMDRQSSGPPNSENKEDVGRSLTGCFVEAAIRQILYQTFSRSLAVCLYFRARQRRELRSQLCVCCLSRGLTLVDCEAQRIARKAIQ